jgi:hypothetical protein
VACTLGRAVCVTLEYRAQKAIQHHGDCKLLYCPSLCPHHTPFVTLLLFVCVFNVPRLAVCGNGVCELGEACHTSACNTTQECQPDCLLSASRCTVVNSLV